MKTRRRNYNRDRFSDLPDCVLINILSSLVTKDAVQTCILSTRWKNLWKLLPVLSMDSLDFNSLSGFNKFVSRIFSLRDEKTALHDLKFSCHDSMPDRLLKRIIKYAFSHDVKILNVKIFKLQMGCSSTEHFPLYTYPLYDEPFRLPLCNFSNTLTSLKLTASYKIFPNSLNFPALTNLSIQFFVFRSSGDDGSIEPFSAFNSLNTLIIDRCLIHDEHNLSISSATLVNLKIQMFPESPCKFELSTPNLFSFDFKGNPIQKLSESNINLSSIKHVSIDVQIKPYARNYPFALLNWLIKLSLVESLTVSSGTLQILYLVPDLFKIDFPYLHNLKSLKIKIKEYKFPPIPHGIDDFLLQNKIKEYKFPPIPHGIDDFLLQNAPSAQKSILVMKKKGGRFVG